VKFGGVIKTVTSYICEKFKEVINNCVSTTTSSEETEMQTYGEKISKRTFKTKIGKEGLREYSNDIGLRTVNLPHMEIQLRSELSTQYFISTPAGLLAGRFKI
jgi:hypothetical protein